jgi:hypothetical protein
MKFLLVLIMLTNEGDLSQRQEVVLEADISEATCMSMLDPMPEQLVVPEYGVQMIPACFPMDPEDETEENSDGQE